MALNFLDPDGADHRRARGVAGRERGGNLAAHRVLLQPGSWRGRVRAAPPRPYQGAAGAAAARGGQTRRSRTTSSSSAWRAAARSGSPSVSPRPSRTWRPSSTSPSAPTATGTPLAGLAAGMAVDPGGTTPRTPGARPMAAAIVSAARLRGGLRLGAAGRDDGHRERDGKPDERGQQHGEVRGAEPGGQAPRDGGDRQDERIGEREQGSSTVALAATNAPVRRPEKRSRRRMPPRRRAAGSWHARPATSPPSTAQASVTAAAPSSAPRAEQHAEREQEPRPACPRACLHAPVTGEHLGVPPGEHRPLADRAGRVRLGHGRSGCAAASAALPSAALASRSSSSTATEVAARPALTRPAECGPAASGSRTAGRERRRSGGGRGETTPRSGELEEAARPCGGRVAEAGQPLEDLFQAVRAEVAECRRRRAVERQVPAGGEDDHLVAAGGVERAARGEHHGDRRRRRGAAAGAAPRRPAPGQAPRWALRGRAGQGRDSSSAAMTARLRSSGVRAPTGMSPSAVRPARSSASATAAGQATARTGRSSAV